MTTYYNYFGGAMALSGAPTNWLAAGGAGDTVTGAAGDDQLSDVSLPDVTLVGGPDDNTYYVGITSVIPDETDTVVDQSASGVNTVYDWANYVLPDNIQIATVYSQHVLIGNSDNDLLFANDAGGVLVAGSGDDVLVGGAAGDNTFTFGSNAAYDVVYNFITSGANHDSVELADLGFTSLSQVEANLSQDGSDVKLTLSQTSAVIFRDTTVSAFQGDDFLLQLDESQLSDLTPTFDDEFNALSLYNSATGAGTWKTNFFFGVQSDASSRTLPDSDNIYVDPSYAGSGSTALGIDPFSISNGVLSITANPTPTQDLGALGGYQYTSGLLTTQTSFSQEYGYFEIRAELPSGAGMWPAFWLLPTDDQATTEIDVFEQLGGDTVYQTSHSAVAGVQSGLTYLPGLTDGFHTFGLLWTPQALTWYVDGQATFSIATPADMNQPMYVLLNLAVGGSWPGDPTSDSEFPASFDIDYVHVYSLSEVSQLGLQTASASTSMTTLLPTADLLGADQSDLLIESTSGAVVVGQVGANGETAFTQIGALGAGWTFDGSGDFLNDGKDQFLIENTTGAVVAAEVSAGGQATYTQIAALGSEWTFVGAGDYLGDGQDQFLIESTAGAVVVGEVGASGRATYTQVGALGPQWAFTASGDFLGDGKSQFLLENTDGAVVVGEVGSSGQAAYTQVGALGSTWSFEGAGDFLGEGYDQVLIQNRNGTVDLGEIGTNGQFAWTEVGALGAEWRFVGVGDYTGSGIASFLIENTSGVVCDGSITGGRTVYTEVTGLGSEWAFRS